jgi:hypothetical protein
VLRYRDLLQVEALFRAAKALMRTRPNYHSSDAVIRGHVFCSFLALVLHKELHERCAAAGSRPEWADILHDLDTLQSAAIDRAGTAWVVRLRVAGAAAAALKALRPALLPSAGRPARPTRNPPQHPRQNAAATHGIVRCAPEFPESANQIRPLEKRAIAWTRRL